MKTEGNTAWTIDSEPPETGSNMCCLDDLVRVLFEEAGEGNDDLAPAAIPDLLESGNAKWLKSERSSIKYGPWPYYPHRVE